MVRLQIPQTVPVILFLSPVLEQTDPGVLLGLLHLDGCIDAALAVQEQKLDSDGDEHHRVSAPQGWVAPEMVQQSAPFASALKTRRTAGCRIRRRWLRATDAKAEAMPTSRFARLVWLGLRSHPLRPSPWILSKGLAPNTID